MRLAPLGRLPEVRKLFAQDPTRRFQLLAAAWPQAVGPELRARTRPEALSGNVLRVRVPDARWRKVLFGMQREIVERLRAGLGGELAPWRLSFVEGGLAEAATPPPAAVSAPAPSALPEGLRRAAAGIADVEIRGRFEDSAARYLARARRDPD